MNAFIKYIGKRVAAENKFEIVNEEVYLQRVEDALLWLLSSRIFIEDAASRNIIKKIDEESEE